MPPATHNAGKKPPSFIDGLAWSFIGLSTLSASLAAVQYLLFAHLLPMAPLRGALADAIALKLLPTSALHLLAHLPALFLGLFALSLLTLLVSIALLQRRNWARITFAWIMIATAFAHLAGLLLPFYFSRDFSAALNAMPPELHGVAVTVTRMLSAMSIVMGIAFGAAFAWIAKRLFSAETAREFATRDDAENPQGAHPATTQSLNPPSPPTPSQPAPISPVHHE